MLQYVLRIGAEHLFKTALKWYVYTNTLCIRNLHNSTLADGGGEEVVYESGSFILSQPLIKKGV